MPLIIALAMQKLEAYNWGMVHDRLRYLAEIVRKKLTFSPVVSIQGARQTGKSFLARNLLSADCPNLVYRTFDRAADREFAATNPDSFLAQYAEASPLVIDEAQKVPAIFDAVKLAVDERRTPGRFLLLGSTEFSKLTKVRESLTGRLSKARLFPFTLGESLHRPLAAGNESFFLSERNLTTRDELMRFLVRGGLPGIFGVHNDSERQSLLNDWLELTVQRDIHLFPKVLADSALAYRILQGIAQLDHPDLAALARYCRRDSRVIKRHLEMLETLFVIQPLLPHPLGTGKPIYFLVDVALAATLGANFERQLYTWVVHELFAKRAYLEQFDRNFFYFRNSKGSLIELVEERSGKLSLLKLIYEERTTPRNFFILKAFKNRQPEARLFALGAERQSWRDEGVEVYPWEGVA